ncbi:hypothetical protein ACHAXH_001028 [Discostella pseudostelligera]
MMHLHSLLLRFIPFGCLILLGRLQTARGEQEPRDLAPFSDNIFDSAVAATGATTDACGLVETTFDDPDWVMATSDRILRLNRCLASPPCEAELWYDSPFKPCYSENRFWKFQKDSEIAFAYPLDALGTGSFDSLYVRRSSKLQFFEGIGDANPFGPELVGPQYVSLSGWKDIACDGFEPNTFFVTGDIGGLKDYSLKIGETDANLIKGVDTMEETNEKDHNTDQYKGSFLSFWDYFVLRRASTFTVEVKMAKEYSINCHEIFFEARHNFDENEMSNYWDVEQGDISTNWLGIKSVELKIKIPPDAPVGAYDFKVLVRNRGQSTAVSEMQFDDQVIVIFNPWSSSDTVHLIDSAQRNEYVMNENGILYGTSNGYTDILSPADITETYWRFGQFDKISLETVLKILESQPSSVRADAKLVSRLFSKMVNSQNDGGVIVGKWKGDFSGGRHPGYWSGSDQILEEYSSTGSPVQFGQCWVYAAVLTTLLRTVGIPSRPLTNFNSGHDVDKDKIVNRYYNLNGEAVGGSDSAWNFHVWNDVWLSNEWHAVDGTPQETSDGFFQLGPAPHSAIKSNSGGVYDVDFVVAEVDAVYREWRQSFYDPGYYSLTRNDPALIGRMISTKTVGSSARSDITSEYKTPEIPEFRLLSSTQSVVDVTFTAPSEVAAGSDIILGVNLSNSAASLSVRILITSSAISYDGTLLALLKNKEVFADLLAGATLTIPLIVPAVDYLKWTDVTYVFESTFGVDVENSDFVAAEVAHTAVIFPPPSLMIIPNKAMATNTDGVATLTFANPLHDSIGNAIVTFSVGGGLTLGGVRTLDRSVGTLLAGRTLTIKQTFTTISEGSHLMTARLSGDKVVGVVASVYIPTFSDCNANGKSDSADIGNGSSQDCNSNGVPDECEPDCNRNGKPDDCDISNNPLLDCNENRIPDACDVTSGFSPDKNNNGFPDECDLDCNANGTPDDLDIHLRVSSDFNHNGVPDECDIDCNENGISDELDIADSTSIDSNLNGVPDECENTIADCNENDIPDSDDIATKTSLDCNINDVPDECDVDSGLYRDCNNNGIPDECEPDCNGNGVPDDCDVDTGSSLDCNSNGVPDECDVATGSSEDYNKNGIPDECEANPPTSRPTKSKPTSKASKKSPPPTPTSKSTLRSKTQKPSTSPKKNYSAKK